MGVMLVYAAGLIGICMLGLLLYVVAVASRKSYTCPQCGERVRVEHMEASHCTMCGAPLERNGGDFS